MMSFSLVRIWGGSRLLTQCFGNIYLTLCWCICIFHILLDLLNLVIIKALVRTINDSTLSLYYTFTLSCLFVMITGKEWCCISWITVIDWVGIVLCDQLSSFVFLFLLHFLLLKVCSHLFSLLLHFSSYFSAQRCCNSFTHNITLYCFYDSL